MTSRLLVHALAMLAGLALSGGITAITLRVHRRRYAPLLAALAALGPRHLMDETAVYTGEYLPRHAADYEPHHGIARGGPVELGQRVDGDVALVRAYVLVDVPTFAGVAA